MMRNMNEIEKKIWANGGPMEAISKTNPKAAERIRKELKYIDSYYESASKKYCGIMSFYQLDWYYDLCEELGLEPKCLSCFSYTAQSEFYSIDWVEHDLIIAFNPTKKVYHDMDSQTGCTVSYHLI